MCTDVSLERQRRRPLVCPMAVRVVLTITNGSPTRLSWAQRT
jgi:hypothetical protein